MAEGEQDFNLILLELYKNLDQAAEERAKALKATCRKGCTHCCYLLVTATFGECLPIACWVLRRSDWKGWAETIASVAKAMSAKDMTAERWFSERRPCVFLDTTERTCRVYGARPEQCRYHFVISPPEDCSVDAPGDREFLKIDMSPLSREVWKLTSMLHDQLGLGTDTFVGPFPFMLFWAMVFLTKDCEGEAQDAHEFLRNLADGIPTPEEWIKQNANALLTEEHGKKLDLEAAKKLLEERP